MIRSLRVALGLLSILLIMSPSARAQWGYGGWGWGGWGANTPQGAALQGAGQFAAGAGMYNLSTAQAASINADTAMRWNQYVYLSNEEATRRYTTRRNAEIAKNRALYDAHQRHLRENPEAREVENGDALNAALTDLNDPRLSLSAVSAANAPVPSSVIAEIPFLYASERVTIILDQIRESIKWPDVFKGERFATTQATFDELRKRLREESEAGEVSAKALKDARQYVSDLRSQLETQPLQLTIDQEAAMTFLTSCSSLLDLLEKPDIGPAILELRKVTDTQVANLLGFMHAFNLRFGPAKTVPQRQAYRHLWPILDQTRREILAAAKLGGAAGGTGNPKDATNFLSKMKPKG
jgi:hypothetical protein